MTVYPLAILLTGMLSFAAFCYFNNYPEEDAYITYVFSKNLLEGNGLTYNGLHVEGYTNLLMAILTAFWAFLTRLPVDSAGYMLSFGFAWITALLFFQLLYDSFRQGLPRPKAFLLAFLATLTLHANVTYLYWSYFGMESSLYSACVLTALLAQKRHPRLALAIASILPLVRYDAIVVCAGLTLIHFVRDLLKQRPRTLPTTSRLLTRYLFTGLLVLMPFGASVLFRYFYYGDTVPNTSYVKFFLRDPGQRLIDGMRYVWGFLWVSKFLVLMLIVAVTAYWKRLRLDLTTVSAAVLFCISTLHAGYVGGDVVHKAWFRFCHLPAVLFLLFCANSLKNPRFQSQSLHFLGVILLFLFVRPIADPSPAHGYAMFYHPLYRTYRLEKQVWFDDLIQREPPLQRVRKQWTSLFRQCPDIDLTWTGKLIREISAPNERLMTTAAGKIVYHAEIPTLDMSSLASRTVWHRLSPREQYEKSLDYEFMAVHCFDAGLGPLLPPQGKMQLLAIIDSHRDMFCYIFTQKQNVAMPDRVDGRPPIQRHPIEIHGKPCHFYSPHETVSPRRIATIRQAYEHFRQRNTLAMPAR